ncbi:MAG: hypothetical protein ACYDC5_01945 [Candidatus Dormibacteria bacterium]
MNWKFLKHEWGAAAFIGTIILGGVVVLVWLLFKAAFAAPIPPTPPCPKETPIVIHANPSPSAGISVAPTPQVTLPSVPFGCSEPSVVVITPTPSPTAKASSSPSASASVSPKASASPTKSPAASATP